MTYRLLDLFSGAGGAGVGYARAGFDVTGVDLNKQRRYPYEFHQADALEVLRGNVIDLSMFDAIHASPPCQAYSITRNTHHKEHPDLLPDVRALLLNLDKPWVIENVPGAPMPGALVLCGTEFKLRTTDLGGREIALRRHRLFQSNIFLLGAGGCFCRDDRARGRIAGVYGNGATSVERARARHGGYAPPDVATKRRLLGIDWMSRNELAQAIPPAYTQFIGEQLIAHLESQVAA